MGENSTVQRERGSRESASQCGSKGNLVGIVEAGREDKGTRTREIAERDFNANMARDKGCGVEINVGTWDRQKTHWGGTKFEGSREKKRG